MGAVTQYPGEGDVESWFLGVGKAWNTDKRKKKKKLDVFEAKIEESEKAKSHRELNPGHLACAASTLPLNYDN